MAQRKAAMVAAAFFVLLAVAPLLCAPAAAELVRLEHPAKNDGSLSLLVVGDWGRKGTYNQSRVAQQVTTADNCPRNFFVS
jgi:tartrate-resistant acid phosphatase type 5